MNKSRLGSVKQLKNIDSLNTNFTTKTQQQKTTVFSNLFENKSATETIEI
jgi:hypothetical protein